MKFRKGVCFGTANQIFAVISPKLKVCGKITDGSDRESFQEDLNRLVNWADKWKMEFNVRKCKLMHVGRSKANFKYTMKGNTLQETSLEKDLGVIITDDGKTSSQFFSMSITK